MATGVRGDLADGGARPVAFGADPPETLAERVRDAFLAVAGSAAARTDFGPVRVKGFPEDRVVGLR
jgi:hypothetical protein